MAKAATAAFEVGRLDRFGQPRADVGVDPQPIDHHVKSRRARQRGRRRHRRTTTARPSMTQPAEAFPPQRVDRWRDRIEGRLGAAGAASRQRGFERQPVGIVLGRAFRRFRSRRRRFAFGSSDARRQPRRAASRMPTISRVPGGSAVKRVGDELCRLPDHVAPALAADRAADPRIQQPQIIVSYHTVCLSGR